MEGVNSIGQHSFSNCRYLEELILPNTLKKIDYNAFYDCVSLKQIIGGSGVQEVLYNSFYNINKDCIIDDSASFTVVF